MQLSNILLTLLAATAVAARGDGRGGRANSNSTSTEPTTDRQKCKALDRMQNLVDLAANTTRLADKTDNDPTKIAEIQAKASDAAARLPELQGNATLMATCAGIFAMEDTMDDCDRIQRIQKQMTLAANETRLAEKFDGNQTKIDEFKAKVTEKSTEVSALQANTTLLSICATAETMGDCQKMAKLQKTIDRGANDTLLATKFDGNQTKIDEFKAKATEAETKLAEMQANTTLTGICSSAAVGTEGKSAADSGSTTSDSTTPSAAIRSIEGASGFITIALAGVMTLMFAL